MNVLFVYSLNVQHTLPKQLEGQDEIQFGISYISSFLKKHGHNTKLIVLTRKTEYSVIDEYIHKFCPKIICFTAIATEYLFIENIAKYIKNQYPSIFLLMGGVHVSLNPEEAMLNTFDALCIGEGETATLELIKQLEKESIPSGIANLWIKRGFEIEKNHLKPFLQDLDSLPFPDREMWQEWIDEPKSRHAILLGRGCPFKCTYCCNHALNKLTTGTYVRFRSPDNILAEIREIVEKFPTTKDIYLEVETVGAAKQSWIIELCSKIETFNAERPQPIAFGVNIRITRYTDKLETLFAALRRANFRHINIGLESGSEKVRREILNRNYSNQDIIDTVQLARKYGLQVHFFNMIGIPGETIDDFIETVKMNRICKPDFYYLYIFYPYPGTDLYSLCKERGLLEQHPPDAKMERVVATLDLPEFTKEQIQSGFIWFDYFVKHKLQEIVAIILMDIIKNVIYERDKQKYKILPVLAKAVIYGFYKRVMSRAKYV